jgi:hypothetical protein
LQRNKEIAKHAEHTEVKKARQSKTKMAHTTLVGMLREDGAAKSMASVMKEIVLSLNVPEDTRREEH